MAGEGSHGASHSVAQTNGRKQQNDDIGLQRLVTKTLSLDGGTPALKREELRDYFLKTWDIDERLFIQLKSDDVFYKRGDPLRHIILFYFGHTAAFFINKFFIAKIIDQRINPEYESIFAIGVDEMSWDDLNNSHYDWPTVAKVREYRAAVKQFVLGVIDTVHIQIPITQDSPFWVIMMAIEHTHIHLETSSVLIRQLPADDIIPGCFGLRCRQTGAAPKNELVPVKGGSVVLGKPFDHPVYGWDSEYGRLEVEVASFGAARYLTSNGEFLEFVEAGGYQKKDYWTEEGWNWVSGKKVSMPLFWRRGDGGYRLRLVDEEVPMPWDWPVETNYLEAKAFCNWKTAATGKPHRMLTEAEWKLLHDSQGVPDELEWRTAPGNIGLEHFASSCPVNVFRQGEFYDIVGNVWQWTETVLDGLPGFRTHPCYDDFSVPTFDGQHNVIKGGSWISTGNEAAADARYAFRRHFYQHAGFRYVQAAPAPEAAACVCETDREVAAACEAAWGPAGKAFAAAMAGRATAAVPPREGVRVLLLNAGVGRLAFELGLHYRDVTALDFTARMLRPAVALQERGLARYAAQTDGELTACREVRLADHGYAAAAPHVHLAQDNPMNLKPLHSGFDLVVLPELVEALSDPGAFLAQVHARLRPGGKLVIASTYRWDESKTPRAKWLGGFRRDGEAVSSFDGLAAALAPHFAMEGAPEDIERSVQTAPRVREARTLQLTVWKLQ